MIRTVRKPVGAFGAVALILALGLSGLAVLLGVLLTNADRLRDEVARVLSERVGLAAEIGQVGLGFVAWEPRLVLSRVDLSPLGGEDSLAFERLELDIDLVASIAGARPAIRSIALRGADIAIERGSDGRFSLAGLERNTSSNLDVLTGFFKNGRFELIESRIQVLDRQYLGDPIVFTDVDIRLHNRTGQHLVALDAGLAADPDARLDIRARLMGPAERPDTWRGEIYARFLGEIEPLASRSGIGLSSGPGRLEAWADLNAGRMTGVLANFVLDDPVIGPFDYVGRIELARAQGLLRWQRRPYGWQLAAREVQLTATDGRRAASDLAGMLDFSKTGWSLTANGETLELDAFAELMPPAVGLSGLAGQLSDFDFTWQADAAGQSNWSARGRATDLGLRRAVDGLGVRGLALTFDAASAGGQVWIDAEDMAFEWPAMFDRAIDLATFDASVGWSRHSSGDWHIDSPQIVALNDDIETRSRLVLRLPADGASPVIDLRTEFGKGKASSVSSYLPTGVLGPKLIAWLDRALVAGHVPRGEMILSGPLDAYPFDGGEGRFLVDFTVAEGILDYQPGWPRLEEIVGQVTFEGRELRIVVPGAKLLGSAVSQGSAHIPDLFETDRIEVAARAEGPFEDGRTVLSETPLAERFGRLAAMLEVGGSSRLDIELSIPLHQDAESTKLNGELSWDGQAQLGMRAYDLMLEDLAGTLTLTENGIRAESIAANLSGRPLSLRIAPSGDGRSTIISAEGVHPIETIAQRYPNPLWDPVSGRLDWGLEVGIANDVLTGADTPLDFRFQSDLTEVAIDMPEPLGKPRDTKRAFTAAGRFNPGQGIHLDTRLGDAIGEFEFAADSAGKLALTHGRVADSEHAKFPKAEGDLVAGFVDLDLGAWIEWLSHRKGDDGAPGISSFDSIALRGKQVRLGDGVSCSDLAAHLTSDGQRQTLSVEAEEFSGRAMLADSARESPLEVRLDRLDLAAILGGSGGRAGAPTRDAADPLDPRRMHGLDLQVEQLYWDDILLGRVIMNAKAATTGLVFTDIMLHTDPAAGLLAVEGEASWTVEDRGTRSALYITIKSADLGQLLRSLGFDSLLDKAPTEIRLVLEWDGGPADISLQALEGRIDAQIAAGSLLDVEPGIGRVLGVLNLAALKRRLSLDFSDLFERGYAFEYITARLTLDNGKARIGELTIDGPSARVSIDGTTDLVAQRFEQIATVTPRLGSGVAVAGAVAGGPLVGAAVYIADQVTGRAVDRLGRHRYLISGSWEDPEIRREGATETGKTEDASEER